MVSQYLCRQTAGQVQSIISIGAFSASQAFFLSSPPGQPIRPPVPHVPLCQGVLQIVPQSLVKYPANADFYIDPISWKIFRSFCRSPRRFLLCFAVPRIDRRTCGGA
jgi:hypothetical protein